MSLPVTIENEFLRLEVFPQFGGKIASIVDKADKFELLFDYAAELPTGVQYDRPYSEGWHAGWDECFPAVAPGKYPKRPYDGISIPDHGELWGMPANATPTRDGITISWHGLRFGYVLTRSIALEGASILAHYTLTNLAPFDFWFVWAQHGVLSLASAVELDLDEIECRISHDAAGENIDRPLTWPMSGDGIDFSRPSHLPAKQAWKIYSKQPIAGPARISYPSRGRSLTIDYASTDDLPAYWGIWLNNGGWMSHKHLSVEATMGRYDQLDRAVADGSAGRIEPNAKREWTCRWTVS